MSLPIERIPEWILTNRRITPDGCWEWAGRRDAWGYGLVRMAGRRVVVHRYIAHLFHGLDLDDRWTFARHKCDNPPCFNPDHIEPGTPADNANDTRIRGRAARAVCRAGLHRFAEDGFLVDRQGRRYCLPCREERRGGPGPDPRNPATNLGVRNGRARFTDEQIVEMRSAYAAGSTCAEIARRWGASPSYMSRIMRGQGRPEAAVSQALVH